MKRWSFNKLDRKAKELRRDAEERLALSLPDRVNAVRRDSMEKSYPVSFEVMVEQMLELPEFENNKRYKEIIRRRVELIKKRISL